MTTEPNAKQKPSKGTLASVLDFLVNDPVLANAMRSVGYKPNTVFLWAKLSRDGDERFRLRWPDPEGAEIWFHDGIVVARQMQCATFEATLRRDCTIGTPRILRQQDGALVYEVDHKAIADWEGDADAAKRIGGLHDPFYLHDQHGARVPVVVFDPAPAALRQHVARSVLPGFNPSDRKEIDAKHSGGVMIVKATRQGDPPKALPPYARERAGLTAEPLTPQQQDLLQRLEDLRAPKPGN
jgi:hypothetical protein